MATNQPSCLVVFSGGLDSTVAVYDAIDAGYKVDLISFNYGQKHKKELDYAKATATKLDLRHDICDLSGLTSLLAEGGSALISETPVPEGHYAEENMKQTVVPNRNMIMLAIAGGVAVARSINYVVTGVHAGDHAVYPDCRPPFVDHMSEALVIGNAGFGQMWGILAPFAQKSKGEIARRGILLKVPFEETWSCYKGEEDHCGRCGTCVERLEAISDGLNMLEQEGNPIQESFYDATPYEDDEFWITATEGDIK